ncbi:catechol 2,3-dioxygenase, partial [Alteribacillus bidgolensis]
MNFDIIRTGRAVLHVTDLDKSRAFYDALGFIETEFDQENIFFRGLEEHNHHSLWLKKKPEPAVEVISYKVRAEEDLEKLESFFTKQGRKVTWLEKGSQKALGKSLR